MIARQVVLAPVLVAQALRTRRRRRAAGRGRHRARPLGATRRDVSHAAFAVRLDAAGLAADGVHSGEPVCRVCGEALAGHIAALAKSAGERGFRG